MPAPPGTSKGIGDTKMKDKGFSPGGSKDTSSKDTSNPFDSRLKNQRYQRTKTKTYKATVENMLKLGGTILGGALAPGVTSALGPLAADAMGQGFTDPTGTSDSFSYDNKGTARRTAEPDQKLAPPKPKKKKPKVTGLTLLDGAGGQLLGT